MVYCTDCGMNVGEAAKFCPECGQEVSTGGTGGEDAVPSEEELIEEADEPEEGVDWSHAAVAVLIGLFPAFGVYMMTSIALYNPMPAIFLLGIPVFGYLLYQRSTPKAMVGGALFWLAVELFLTPLSLLIYTISFASNEVQTGAGQAGAALGGFVLMVVAFVVCIPIGVVFYLVGGRLDDP